MKKQRQSVGYWRNHYDLWLKTSMSKKDYAQDNKLNRSAFYCWSVKIEKQYSSPDLATIAKGAVSSK